MVCVLVMYPYRKEECCWKSAANRVVRLEATNIHQLCEAERETLKTLALQKLAEEGFSNITLPKDKRVSPSRRWKQLLPLIRNSKGLPEQKCTEEKARNPVFAVDLCQAIENDKAEERADENEMALAKLDCQLLLDASASENDNSLEQSNENTFPKGYYGKRNSDPLINRYSLRNGDKPEMTVDNLIPTSQSNERDYSHHRVSRLIEALSLSSTTASSMCVLDRDTEFTPPISHVPKVMKYTTDFITNYGLHAVHIFRNEGSKKRVKKMREDFDNGEVGVITESSNPLDVAALFKDFIRNLPEPLLTRELYNGFISIGKIDDEEVYNKFLKLLIWLLPVPNRDTLEVVLKCLKLVAENAEDKCDENGNIVTPGNKMDSKSIATIMAPNVLYRYKGYKTNNPYQIDEENKIAIDAFHALISLTDELFVIEKDIHDEVLKRLLETDPETVDYVLRKKSTRTSLVEVLRSSADDLGRTSPKRPSSLGMRYVSETESEVKKAHSFNNAKTSTPIITKRRHLSTVTRPEMSKLESPDRGGGFSKFSRSSRLRMSLGSREFRGRTGNKSSPGSSPFSSKRSFSRKERNGSQDNSSTSNINERNNSHLEPSYHNELPGVFLGLGRNQSLQNSLSSNTDSETGSKGENIDVTPDSSSESVSSKPPEKAKKTLPAKIRKISLPAFLHSNSSDRSIFRSHGKASSIDVEELVAPSLPSTPGDENVFESIKEASDTENTDNITNLDSLSQGSETISTRRRTLMESLTQDDGAVTKARIIDWNKKEDWPEWQLQVIASGFVSQETTL